MSPAFPAVTSAQMRLSCADLDATSTFFIEQLGFRLQRIYPADAPTVLTLQGYGLRLCLVRDAKRDSQTLQLYQSADSPNSRCTNLMAPNGTCIELLTDPVDAPLPPLRQRFSLVRLAGEGGWVKGRAGMQYRDLIPEREGGRFIASHIRIADAGPVPDYVHFHSIRFQLIYCYKGWVRVVYEDQGPEFVMHAGDCVLQPPYIRHRVLEASAGLEVVEIGCPAEHVTHVEHALALPNADVNPARDFSGQKFVLHQLSQAIWTPWHSAGFTARDLGVGSATDGVAQALVARKSTTVEAQARCHNGEFLFVFVLQGMARLRLADSAHDLREGDAITLPSKLAYQFVDASDDFEVLEVALPATTD